MVSGSCVEDDVHSSQSPLCEPSLPGVLPPSYHTETSIEEITQDQSPDDVSTVSNTTSPLTTTKSPLATTKSPLATTKSPLATIKSPLATTKSPLTTTKSPLTTATSHATPHATATSPLAFTTPLAIIPALPDAVCSATDAYPVDCTVDDDSQEADVTQTSDSSFTYEMSQDLLPPEDPIG